MSILEDRYRQLHAQIPKAVTLVAVSKGQPIEKIIELYQLGHRDFGENYVQEFLDKKEKTDAEGLTDIRWHFIGHLQSNKVKALVPHVFCIHSVDSDKLVKEISKRVLEIKRLPIPCLIEVRLSNEENKTGIDPVTVPTLVKTMNALDGVGICGLMGLPSPERSDKKEPFRALALLAKSAIGPKAFLSMGMSSDYLEAIECGATHIRIGTSLFGPRT